MAAHKLSATTISTICGRYKVVKEENFENFSKKIGVGIVLRKIAGSSTTHLELSYNKEKDTWVLKHSVGPKSKTTEFKLGQHFPESTIDGRTVTTMVKPSPDNNKKWIYEQVCEKNPEHSSTVTWEFSGERMVATYQSGDVIAKQYAQIEK